jgi:hypothetical protein
LGEVVRVSGVVRGLAVMLAVAACAASFGVVGAEEGQGPPCLADVQRWCNLVPPTGSFVQGCLEMHGDDLSARCRRHVGNLTRDTGTLTSACQRDINTVCENDPMSGDGHVGCLVTHRDKLSTGCREAIDQQSRE